VYVDAEGKSFVIGNAADVTDEVRAATRLAEANRVLTDLATTDQLTGLPNRRRFDDRLAVALAQARRDGTRLALIFIDLDHFKKANDTFGHAAGDALLQSVSRQVTGVTRSSDTLARVGGDEFVLLLVNVEGKESAERVAGKIHQLFREPIDIDGNLLRVTLSIGISVFPDDGKDADALLRRADAAMYVSKQARSRETPSDSRT
jgi:diguanylate cyclase (GGDEF)-like protein